MFNNPRIIMERFFNRLNFLSVERIIKIAKNEAKANLIKRRSIGLENLKAYLIIGKEVLHRKEDIRIKSILCIF